MPFRPVQSKTFFSDCGVLGSCPLPCLRAVCCQENCVRSIYLSVECIYDDPGVAPCVYRTAIASRRVGFKMGDQSADLTRPSVSNFRAQHGENRPRITKFHDICYADSPASFLVSIYAQELAVAAMWHVLTCALLVRFRTIHKSSDSCARHRCVVATTRRWYQGERCADVMPRLPLTCRC